MFALFKHDLLHFILIYINSYLCIKWCFNSVETSLILFVKFIKLLKEKIPVIYNGEIKIVKENAPGVLLFPK